MRRKGVTRISRVTADDAALQAALTRAAQLENVARCTPDQKEMLVHLGQLFGVGSLWDLCKKVGYSQEPELLTMWLCLFSAKELSTDHVVQLLEHPRARNIARGRRA